MAASADDAASASNVPQTQPGARANNCLPLLEASSETVGRVLCSEGDSSMLRLSDGRSTSGRKLTDLAVMNPEQGACRSREQSSFTQTAADPCIRFCLPSFAPIIRPSSKALLAAVQSAVALLQA